MSWGAHGAMGELKSPLSGMVAGHCLVPCDLASLGLGSLPVFTPVARLLVTALFPVTLGRLDMGVCQFPCCSSLLFCVCSLVLVLVCSRLFALAAWFVSRTLAVAFLGLGLSCCGRVGLRFGLPGLFVRSCSCLSPGSSPARSPWLPWVFA